MQEYALPYGHEQLPFHLPADLHVDWIKPPYVPAAADPLKVVRDALAHPVDGIPLSSYSAARTVAIAINDKTRPVPHEHLLPPLLDALHAAGIPAEAITFFIATGTHVPMPADEFTRVLPKAIAANYRVVSHNCDDAANLLSLGVTTRGTPILVNRAYTQSD